MPLKVNNCIVCEDLRPDADGRATVLGYAGVLPDIDLRVRTLSAPIERMMLCFSLGKGVGSFDIEFEIFNPFGKSISTRRTIGKVELNPLLNSIVGIVLNNMKFDLPGSYNVTLFANGVKSYSSTFDVIEGEGEAVFPKEEGWLQQPSGRSKSH